MKMGGKLLFGISGFVSSCMNRLLVSIGFTSHCFALRFMKTAINYEIGK